MCGILGITEQRSEKEIENALKLIRERGRDGEKIIKTKKLILAHCLHSIVGEKILQPFQNKEKTTLFAANCEIYNWEALAKKHKLKARNDAELLFLLLESLEDGVFSYDVFDSKDILDDGFGNKDVFDGDISYNNENNNTIKNNKNNHKEINNKTPKSNSKQKIKSLQNSLKNILEQLDGDFAFVYQRNNKIILARDRIGVKPLWFCEKPFAFSSEKKALKKLGYKFVEELNPRKILIYDEKKEKINFLEQEFFKRKKEIQDKTIIKNTIAKLLRDAVKKRIPKKKVGLLFSGGIDSTLLAKILKDEKADFTCYTAAIDDASLSEAPDLAAAKRISKEMGFKLKIKKIPLQEVEPYLKKICPLIEDNNVVKVGVALTFYLACEAAKEDGVKVMLSGLGSEELFAGYERHAQASDVNAECLAGLRKIYERDLYRDDVITMHHGMELRVPYLDHDLAAFSLKIPAKYKINKIADEGNNTSKKYLENNKENEQKNNKNDYKKINIKNNNKKEEEKNNPDKQNNDNVSKIKNNPAETDQKKIILRETAEELFKLPKEFAWRKKQAAQYGSKTDRALAKLAKKKSFATKSEYLKQFYDPGNVKLGALISSGKDSTYAMYIMQKQNYEIACLITLKSKNPDSYMFHTPNIHLAALQAEAMNIPIIEQETQGLKEKELLDLKKALQKAKDQYHIEGIVSGALFSTYQRERIEKIADDLGLKVFCPLWHKDQEEEMRELIYNNFKFILSSVAAEGLDATWLNKEIKEEDVQKLIKLNKKIGLNVAGEGGEYESLVLNCPLFKKKLVLEDVEIREENQNTARLIVKKAGLVDK